jgi:hypothetical protein
VTQAACGVNACQNEKNEKPSLFLMFRNLRDASTERMFIDKDMNMNFDDKNIEICSG